MLHPSYTDLMETINSETEGDTPVVNSRYSIVLATAKRARPVSYTHLDVYKRQVEMFLKKTSRAIYEALGIYLPLITTNCAVLGVALTNVQNGYNLLESVLCGFGTALEMCIRDSVWKERKGIP